ncbi:ribosomal RNA small subunit methyltransferase B [mine drainage metagenome]|uniref:Ribosomal RNA small subunit methyltransferase B n=1 Tax=mine drainage metagenome TaxID=410659 RepID=A0A1J5TYE8_9ZZZZ
MSIAHSQRNTFLGLYRALELQLRRDPGLPARLEAALRRERRFGSRDRRLYRELFYTAVRHLPWVEGADDDRLVGIVAALAAESPATSGFRAAFARPELAAAMDRTLLLPAWFRDECPAAFERPLFDVLQARTPLWLRIRPGAEARVRGEFERLGWTATASGALAGAWRLDVEADVTRTESATAGLVEVQDLGSQMILEAVAPQPGGRWLDACAGAGGKTLQLADLLGEGTVIDAVDVRPEVLDELERRARRAGVEVVGPDEEVGTEQPDGRAPGARVRVGNLGSGYDGVLVDAPCSGSGTWRRAPHLKWTSNPGWIRQCAERQSAVLADSAQRVRPGGVLVYATCSLCRSENEAVVEAFLAANPSFVPVPLAKTFGFAAGPGWLTIEPSRHDTDGFFVAQFRRSI